MTNEPKLYAVDVPFPGFGEGSWFDSEQTHNMESDCEHFASDNQEGVPEALRLDANEIAEVFWKVIDWQAGNDLIRDDYHGCFPDVLRSALPRDLREVFEDLVVKDGVVMFPEAVVRLMWVTSLMDGHERLLEQVNAW
jgi:hypothetical protein